jgi:alanine dehydrogenase
MTDRARHDTLILTRDDVRLALSVEACIDAVDAAFRDHAEGRSIAPEVLASRVVGGGFHMKTAGLLGTDGDPPMFAAKLNANFPANPSQHGLPTIQGIVLLFAADDGRPLAVLDSIEITSVRTAAASAVAARHLARADAATVTVCGCGEQGRSQLRALTCVRPIRRVLAFDVDSARAETYATEMSRELELDVVPVRELGDATRASDIWVTCTPSRRWFVGREQVRPGTLILAVGADNPEKHEIEPELLAASTVVVDVLEQCASIGDLHHALDAGVMTRDDVHAELADVVTGRRRGREHADEIVVFDSTGTALEDVAAARLVYHAARAIGAGTLVDFGSLRTPDVRYEAHR